VLDDVVLEQLLDVLAGDPGLLGRDADLVAQLLQDLDGRRGRGLLP